MPHLRHDDNAHLVLTYEDAGATVTLEGDLAWATLETEENYNTKSSHTETAYTLRLAPAGDLTMRYDNKAVKEYTVTRTAEIEASGSTVAAFESARERVGAPKNALMQIDRWSSIANATEPVQIIANEPVKVRFTWEETVV